MLQTKHVAVFVAVLLIGGFVSLAGILLTRTPQEFADIDVKTQLASPIAAKDAVIEQNDTRERARESLRARLASLAGSVVRHEEAAVSASRGSAETSTDQSDISNDATGLRVGGGGSVSPGTGRLMMCDSDTTGTNMTVPWVRNGRWYPSERPTVDGSTFMESAISITNPEGARVISANGIPAHSLGTFPIQPGDDAFEFRDGEAPITPLSFTLQIPQDPRALQNASCISQSVVAIALNGVRIYRASEPDVSDVGAFILTDRCGGSASASGEYHYVRENACLVDAYYEGAPSTILGYALDGFGLFASLEKGEKVTNSDLDSCHGHVHEIPWDGSLVSMYHYHFTDEFPYSVGCFRGVPVIMP